MVVAAVIIVCVCVFAAALVGIMPCVLSSKISQAEESNKNKED